MIISLSPTRPLQFFFQALHAEGYRPRCRSFSEDNQKKKLFNIFSFFSSWASVTNGHLVFLPFSKLPSLVVFANTQFFLGFPSFLFFSADILENVYSVHLKIVQNPSLLRQRVLIHTSENLLFFIIGKKFPTDTQIKTCDYQFRVLYCSRKEMIICQIANIVIFCKSYSTLFFFLHPYIVP